MIRDAALEGLEVECDRLRQLLEAGYPRLYVDLSEFLRDCAHFGPARLE